MTPALQRVFGLGPFGNEVGYFRWPSIEVIGINGHHHAPFILFFMIL
jgi:hypothetical protein